PENVPAGAKANAIEQRVLHERQRLMDSEYFEGLMSGLADNFILLVKTEVEPGKRRILKYAYEHPVRHVEPNPIRWLAVRLGWWPFKLTLRTPSANLAASYHCEVAAPPGLEFTEARLDPRAPTLGSVREGGRTGRAHLQVSQLPW